MPIQDLRLARQPEELTIREHLQQIRHHARYLRHSGTQRYYHAQRIAAHTQMIERMLEFISPLDLLIEVPDEEEEADCG